MRAIDAAAVADIQHRCKAVAERLQMLAGSPHDLIASADPNQKLFIEAASLVLGYHQCLLVESVLTRTPDEQAEDEGLRWAADGEAAQHPKERW